MRNKQIEITLGDEVLQLWYNNFAVFELTKMYGVSQKDILEKVTARAEDNYLLLLSDLIVVGSKGHSLARGKKTSELLSKVNELVATADMGELMEVWNVFFDIMGGNVDNSSDKKKESPSMKKQNPPPRTKTS